MPWTRPETVPFPSVWGNHTGSRALANGKIPHFRIQDAPVEMFDEIIEHMNTIFLESEPTCSNTSLGKDPVSLQELDDLWRHALQQKTVLVALDVAEDGTTKLAGVNMTVVETKEKDAENTYQGVPMQKVLGLVVQMSKEVNVFETYGVTEYLSAMGLSVAPVYRGQGLGIEILKARVPLCKALGLKVTSTVFTADNSQELARRAGFQTLTQMEYDSFKVNGVQAFPGLKVKLCKTMALKID